MAITFQYPATGGTGAVSGGDLVTACGQYTVPGGGATTTVHGKVYPLGAPLDPSPPGSASGGTCMSGFWHFNGCWPPLGGGLVVGTKYVLRVWQKDSSSGSYVPGDCEFTACMQGSGCEPDCPEMAPAPGPASSFAFGCESIVIREMAARKFRVTLSAAIADMLEMFDLPAADPHKLSILVTYDEAVSTHDRAIWVSQPYKGEQLRLEVQRGGCCYEALVTRIRVSPLSIETLDRWHTSCFDLAAGGELCGLTADCCLRDGGIEVRPVGDVQLFAPAPPLERRTPARAPSTRRARRGKK